MTDGCCVSGGGAGSCTDNYEMKFLVGDSSCPEKDDWGQKNKYICKCSKENIFCNENADIFDDAWEDEWNAEWEKAGEEAAKAAIGATIALVVIPVIICICICICCCACNKTCCFEKKQDPMMIPTYQQQAPQQTQQPQMMGGMAPPMVGATQMTSS